MGFPTVALARIALALAALAGGTAASAAPIKVLNAATPPRAVAPPSDCAAAAAGAGADIECVLSLSPPQGGAEPASPSRILIRAQWAPQRCARRAAQVVDLPGPPTQARALPAVEQAGSGRACAR